MVNLLITVALTILFAFLSDHDFEKRRNLWVFLAIVVYALFMGLRSGYNDTENYIRAFQNADGLSVFLQNPRHLLPTSNPLFYGFQAWIRGWTDNYHIFFMIVAFFNATLLFRFLRRYSSGHFAYAMLLFWGFGTGVFGLAAMKQITAMAILTLAIPAIEDRRWVRFVVIVVVAALVHTYAILFAVLPFFTTRPWDKKTFLIIALTALVILTFNSTVSKFLEYAEATGKSISEEEVFDGVQMNLFRVALFVLIPAALLIYERYLLPDMTRIHCLFGNMSIFAMVFALFGRQNGANMFGRISTYFVLGDICLLGWILEKVFNEKSKDLLYVLSAALFSVFFYVDNVDFATSSGYSSITIIDFLRSLI